MNSVLIFLVLFFILGLFVGPLAMAAATALYSDDRGRDLGDRWFSIGLKAIWRPAFTVNAANELTLKRRAYDEDHDQQKISFGGLGSSVERFLFDPNNRIHDFIGTPFALVDERFGLIFDAKDAAVGRKLDEKQRYGEYTERKEKRNSLVEGVLAVFEFGTPNVGVRMTDVWTLVGVSFDSQLVDKIHEYYRKGQAPKSSTTALRQLLVPVGTLIAVIIMGMLVSGQAAGAGGGGAPSVPNSSVSIGTLALLLGIPSLKDLNKRNALVSVAIGLVSILLVAGLYFAFPVWVPVIGLPLPLGVWAAIMLSIGIVTLPIVSAWFGRSLGPFGTMLGKLWLTIGLLPYDQPVVTQVSDSKYELVEYDSSSWPSEPDWYRFALTRLGIGVNEAAWPEEVTESPTRVESMANVEVDGVAPSGFKPTNLIEVGPINGYVPEDVDENAQYVRTDRTTGLFEEAGQNRRLMNAALEHAKQKYGGGRKPVGDKWVLGSSLVAMLIGIIFDYLVFF